MNASAYTHHESRPAGLVRENGQGMHLDADRLHSAAEEARLTPASLVVLPLDIAAAPVTWEADRPLYPASMIKVPLVAVGLLEVSAGRLASLESTVEIGESNMTANDAASPLVPGYRATIHELMQLAIARSDNVATNVLIDLIGRQQATNDARETLGLASTEFHRKLSGSEPLIDDPDWDGEHRNAHPAIDCAHIMRSIADDAIAHASLLREMLAAQEWNNKLSMGLNPGDRFLHKTGDTDEVTHDGGILITAEGKHYIVVAYTGLASTDEHNARFGPFMRAVREML